jgi:hypothetical protein
MTIPTKFTVAIHGTGKRGKVHAETFRNDSRFAVVAICGHNREWLDAAALLAGDPGKYQDPAEMLRESKPDIFCFCTPPSVRLPLIRLAVEHGVKLIAYEKPMATSFNEAAEIAGQRRCSSRREPAESPRQCWLSTAWKLYHSTKHAGLRPRLVEFYSLRGESKHRHLHVAPKIAPWGINRCAYLLGRRINIDDIDWCHFLTQIK